MMMKRVIVSVAICVLSAWGWGVSGPSTIVGPDGMAFQCRGINWYGMEISTSTVEGLWERDVGDHVRFMREMNFNTLRIPFALQGVMDGWYEKPLSDPSLISRCTSCGPGATPYDVLGLVMDAAMREGIGVILDLHRLNFSVTSPAWYTNSVTVEDTFRGWDIMLDRYLDHPAFMGMDLYNEPHGRIGFGEWDGFIHEALDRYGGRLLGRGSLMLINGIHWGEDMRDFRDFVVDPWWRQITVLSPHSYGPTLTDLPEENINDPSFLFRRWDTYYGYLAEEWPMIIGEWGGNQSYDLDRTWMTTFVEYMRQRGFVGSCFWAWNPNSQDVKGYLLPDWVTPDPFKKQLIDHLFSS